MTRIPKEHAVGPVPVTKAGKPVGCRAPDKALLGAIISPKFSLAMEASA